MASYLDDDFQSPDSPAGSGVGDRDEGDWKLTCPVHDRRYWRQDGCPTCEASRVATSPPTTPTTPESPLLPRAVADRFAAGRPPSGVASDGQHLICGMHPALAEHTLQRCIDAWGGLAGLLVAIQGWEEEPGA